MESPLRPHPHPGLPPTINGCPFPTGVRYPGGTNVRCLTLGKSGHIAQWTATVVFILFTILVAVHSTRVHRKSRTFHYVIGLLSAISALSYYAAATGFGRSFIFDHTEHFIGIPPNTGYDVIYLREVFYGRFVEWFFSTPLILLNLALLAGLSWADTVLVLVLDELMILSAAAGAVSHNAKFTRGHIDNLPMWGWFGFMLLFFIFIFYILAVRARVAAAAQHKHISNLYNLVFGLTFLFIFPYVIIFALGHGSGHIDVNTQTIAFVVLDLGIRVALGILIIHGYQHKADDIGYGPNALPEHVFDHRSHGWTGRIHLPHVSSE